MKISCLTITQLSRINLLRRSLWSFSQQSIGSKFCELIVVHHDGKECTKSIEILLEEFNIEAHIFEVPPSPLGALRNISMEKARGELLCQWDDDDIYHPNRLLVQSYPFNKVNCTATTLAMQLFWFCEKGTLYVRSGGVEGIHGSIMLRNNKGIKYDPTLIKGEDSKIIENLLRIGPESIFRIDGHPELYVRRVHGQNTWSLEHHVKHIQQAMNADWLLENKEKIKEWIHLLQIPSVKICDKNDQIVFST